MKRATDEPPVPPLRLCPVCGTRASDAAVRCLVCGTDLSRASARMARPRRRLYPNLLVIAFLGLVGALGAVLLLLATGAIPLPAALRGPTPTASHTPTSTSTATATRTPSATPVPTATPLPPLEYLVGEGDSCLAIAIDFDVSVESIIMANGLDPDCTIVVGAVIKVPQPTPTSSPAAARTPRPGQATATAQATYVVQAGDTCIGIANRYGITVDVLMALNGLTDCSLLREGQVLEVPAK